MLTTEGIKEKVLPVRCGTSGEPIFANGAQTGAFSYLFGSLVQGAQAAPAQPGANGGVCTTLVCRPTSVVFNHCGTFVAECGATSAAQIEQQFSLPGFETGFDLDGTSDTFATGRNAFLNPGGRNLRFSIVPPAGVSARQFADQVIFFGNNYPTTPYRLFGPNSNSAAAYPIYQSGGVVPNVPRAPGLNVFAP